MNRIAMMDELWEAVSRRLPVMSPEEQRAGIVLLRELAKGEPVTISQLAQALGTTVGTTQALVREWPKPLLHADEGGRIVACTGLTVVPTHHQLTINGRTLWTCCAHSSLYVPELLIVFVPELRDGTAAIESQDPETGELVRLTVSAARIEAADPKGIVLSKMRPDAWDLTSAARGRTTVCSFHFFFASRGSGERWTAKHPETMLLSLDEAFTQAQRSSAHFFGPELAQRSARAA